MDAKQFAWMYLISKGTANKTPSFYGGDDVVDTSYKGVTAKYSIVRFEDEFIEAIKAVGIDWNKTKAPKARNYNQFVSTFHDSESKEYLEGTLVLLDGTTQFWCAEPLILDVFEMMATIDTYKQEFTLLMGDITPVVEE